jgi:hydrogenase nickel incorporation protein HypA/HybF
MHEFSLIKDLLRKIQSIAGCNKVVSVKVTLGALAHISAEHFREHFVEAAAGTIAEGARLEIEQLTDETDPRAQDVLLDSVELEES